MSLREEIDTNKQQQIAEDKLIGRSERVNKEVNHPQDRVMCSNIEHVNRGSGRNAFDCKPNLIAADGNCANEYENFAGGLTKNTLAVSSNYFYRSKVNFLCLNETEYPITFCVPQ